MAAAAAGATFQAHVSAARLDERGQLEFELSCVLAIREGPLTLDMRRTEWTVERSLNDCALLERSLRAQVGWQMGSTTLPSPPLRSRVRIKLSRSQLASFTTRLEQWLQGVLALPDVARFDTHFANAELRSFLAYAQHADEVGAPAPAAGTALEDWDAVASSFRDCADCSHASLGSMRRLVQTGAELGLEMRSYDFDLREGEDPLDLGAATDASRWPSVLASRDPRVAVGSVLVGVGGRDTTDLECAATLDLALGSARPVRLSFSAAPEKSGMLLKRARKPPRNWKSRECFVKDGAFRYFNPADGELKGAFPLVNCTVTVVDEGERRGECLSVNIPPSASRSSSSKGDVLLLKAESYEDMLEWGVLLYRAVAIANGGVVAHLALPQPAERASEYYEGFDGWGDSFASGASFCASSARSSALSVASTSSASASAECDFEFDQGAGEAGAPGAAEEEAEPPPPPQARSRPKRSPRPTNARARRQQHQQHAARLRAAIAGEE